MPQKLEVEHITFLEKSQVQIEKGFCVNLGQNALAQSVNLEFKN